MSLHGRSIQNGIILKNVRSISTSDISTDSYIQSWLHLRSKEAPRNYWVATQGSTMWRLILPQCFANVGQYYMPLRNGFKDTKNMSRTLEVARCTWLLPKMELCLRAQNRFQSSAGSLSDDVDVGMDTLWSGRSSPYAGLMVPAYSMPENIKDIDVQRFSARIVISKWIQR